MTKQFLQDLVNRFSSAYACYKIVFDDKGNTEDFIITDFNRAFEEISGLNENKLSGKSATEALSWLKNDHYDWIGFFEKIAMSNTGQESVCTIKISGQKYKMTAYSPQRMHIVTLLERESEDRMKAYTIDCDAPFLRGYKSLPPVPRAKNTNRRKTDIFSSLAPCEETHGFSDILGSAKRENDINDLYRQSEFLRTIFESIGDGVIAVDREGLITLLNKSAQEITGWINEEVRGRKFIDIFKFMSEETRKPLEDPFAEVMRTGKVISLSNRAGLINKQGCFVPVAHSVAPIQNEKGEIFGVVMVLRGAGYDLEQQEHILDLIYHDFLTGLYNRRFLSENIDRLDTPENLPLSVIIGDVNGLKLTNEALGPAEGDKLLIKVAESFRESCRAEDVIIRWGSDEFLIILPKTPLETVHEIAGKMQDAFIEKSEAPLQISVALGYEVKEKTEQNLGDVLSKAEKWMYYKKLLEGKSHRNAIVNTLLSMLCENDISTEKHSKRLGTYCHGIGRKMDLSCEEQYELSLLAILHDIGKVGIRKDILQKPGSLSSEEWREMRRHPEIGYRIMQNMPELSIISEYILLHHERWDGNGYPKGYKGEKIPLLCRIISIIDAYDVMTTGRVYKRARSNNEAITELKLHAGTQFDPLIVGLFTEVLMEAKQVSVQYVV